ncbi:MAG: aspartate aminotransferase family protein [Bryobacteraceae bacterium]
MSQSYVARTPGSRDLYERALKVFPNGVTHVGRYLEPHPLYVSRAAGSRKWDVDGNEYVDYFGGHGALMLGHSHPAVVAAVTEQVAKGAHYGASHELEIEWAELIRSMVPSAERVRFTISGTEATHLALRISRAFTGRNKIVRFAGHFHGWHDHVSFPPGGAPGILPGIVADTIICPPNDGVRLRELLDQHESEVAAIIVEPTGATFGHVPGAPEFLYELRSVTKAHGIVLIFDEVISGFRCSPGGAQQFYGITPDLTSLAKVLAGGFPGAALVGRADILAMLAYTEKAGRIQPPAVAHQGTYNAGPVSAAAGIATLKLIRDTRLIDCANRTAAAIRDGINAVIARLGLGWCAYGKFSDFHIYCGAATTDDIYDGRIPWTALKGAPSELVHAVRTGFLREGIDVTGWPGGLVSGVHTGDDVDRTVSAFERVIGSLRDEGVL